MSFVRRNFSWSIWTVINRLSSLLAPIFQTVSWLQNSHAEEPPVEQLPETASGSSTIKQNATVKVIAESEQLVMVAKGTFLASGASGVLERLPSGDVAKSPWPGSGADDCRRDIKTEFNIYKTLGQHPRLVRMIDWDPDDCVLIMEYMPNGSLRDYLLVNNSMINEGQRRQWALEAAEGLQLLHNANIIHCDVEPKNFLLDTNLSLKIADFSGSSLEGSRPSACVGRRYSPPDIDWRRLPTIQDDLFGLGSTLYYIMTGQHPFQEVLSDEVEARFRIQKYPDVSNIAGGSSINQCWHAEVTSAQEVYNSIKEIL